MALNDIAAIQTKVTTETESHVNKLLNYIATHQDASLTYHASKIHLIIHSDASYLSVRNSRSRAGGYFYMGNKENISKNNAPVHIECKIMKKCTSIRCRGRSRCYIFKLSTGRNPTYNVTRARSHTT